MDAVEVKEEQFVDVIPNSSYDVLSYEAEGGGELELEQDPLATNTEPASFPSVQDELAALDKLAKMLAPFSPSPELERKPIKVEHTGSEDVIDISDDEIVNLNSDTEVSDIEVLNTSSVKEELSTAKIKAETDVEEKAVAQFAGSDNSSKRVTRSKSEASISSAQPEIPGEDLEICKTFGLQTLTVDIGPRLQVPKCLYECKKVKRLKSSKLKIYSCSSKFTKPATFNAHLKTCTTKSDGELKLERTANLYHCGICIFKFKEIANLKNHMIKHHCKSFSCNICAQDFSTVDELRVHNLDMHKDKSLKKIYTCNVCIYSTANHFHLKDHIIRHITDRHLHCYRCRRNFEDEADYSAHWDKLHDNVQLKKRNSANSEHDPVPSKILENGMLSNFDKDECEGAVVTNEEKTVNSMMLPSESNELGSLCSKYESEIVLLDGFYNCTTCIYKFAKLENLMKHMKLHLDIQKPFKCLECKYESFSVSNMEKHCTQLRHTVNGECNACSFKCKEWRFIKRHAINHVYDGLFCRMCSLNFENYESCKKHMFSHHNVTAMENLYLCNHCSYKHTKEVSRDFHIIRSHMGKIEPPVRNKSSSLLKEKLAQDGEMKIVRGNKKNTIKRKTSVSSSTYLTGSENVLSFDGNLKRPSCNSSLHNHTDYQYKCAKCEFSTSKFGSFLAHDQKKHMNTDKPFHCNICHKKLSLLKFYLNHMSLHSGILVYECPYCKFSCVNKVEFHKHAMNHEFFPCPMCVYKTCNIQLFKKHVENTHKPGRLFLCPLCPHSVNIEKNLSLHCLKFHPQKFCKMNMSVPESLSYEDNMVVGCKLCSFTCKKIKRYDLKQHVIRHFINGSFSRLKSIRLGFKRLKKSSVGRKHSKIRKTSINNRGNKHNFLYYCSKCKKQSKYRGVISSHLRKKHKIIGGVKNNMILKSPIHFPNQKNSEFRDIPVKHTSDDCNISESTSLLKSGSKGSSAMNTTIQEETLTQAALTSNNNVFNKYPYYQCSKCDMKSRHLKSVQNHLKNKHKIIGGGIRNNMIYKVKMRSTRSLKEDNKSLDQSVTELRRKEFSLEAMPSINETGVVNISSKTKQRVGNPIKKTTNTFEAHLSQRKTIADSRSKKLAEISKLSYQPLRDADHISAGRALSNSSMPGSVSSNVDILQSKHKKRRSNLHGVCDTMHQSKVLNLGHTYFICKLCKKYNSKLRHYMYDHLSNFHMVKNPEKTTGLIRPVKASSKNNGTEQNKLSEKQLEYNIELQAQEINSKTSRTISSLHSSSVNSTVSPEATNDSALIDNKLKACKIKCPLCDIHTMSHSAQVDHNKIGHVAFSKKPFSCRVENCGVRLTAFSNLLRHESKHSDSMRSYVCPNCKTFKTYRRDMLICHQNSRRCKKKNSTADGQNEDRSVATHPANLDTADATDDESFTCGECNYVTVDVTQFTIHLCTFHVT